MLPEEVKIVLGTVNQMLYGYVSIEAFFFEQGILVDFCRIPQWIVSVRLFTHFECSNKNSKSFFLHSFSQNILQKLVNLVILFRGLNCKSVTDIPTHFYKLS